MASLIDMRLKAEFHRKARNTLMDAYIAIADGGVQSYTIGSRTLTKFDLPMIRKEIAEHEKTINELEAQMKGGKRRKAVGVIPRDW